LGGSTQARGITGECQSNCFGHDVPSSVDVRGRLGHREQHPGGHRIVSL